jgi:molybdate transport system substrate-binding protein
MKRVLLSAAVAAATLAGAGGTRAAEVTLIAPGGIRAAIEQMIPAFEQKTGHKVKATFGSGGGTKDRVIKGELFDVPVVQPPLEPVLASGHVVKDTETPLAAVWIGVAVKTGAPKPDISTAGAVKTMLLGAKAISYPTPPAAPPPA